MIKKLALILDHNFGEWYDGIYEDFLQVMLW